MPGRLKRKPVCPRCEMEMVLISDGIWKCPDGHAETLINDEEQKVEESPDDRKYSSLSYVPSVRKGGGSKSSRGKSPQKQKFEAWQRKRTTRIKPLDS